MKRKLVLFDIDGTLLLSAGAGRRAILAAVSDLVTDPAAVARVRFDGKTDPQIVAELLEAAGHQPPPPERVAEFLDRYVAMLAAELAQNGHRSRVMPGIPEVLDALEADAGVVLGLLTGNVVPGAALKLRAARLDPARFVVGAYGSDSPRRADLPPIAAERARPLFGRLPSGSEVVIVGDTPEDVRCAGSIGARTVAVATGSFSAAELALAGADLVFEDLRETSRVLEGILS